MKNVLAMSNYTACLFVSIEGGRLIISTGTMGLSKHRPILNRAVANVAKELQRQA